MGIIPPVIWVPLALMVIFVLVRQIISGMKSLDDSDTDPPKPGNGCNVTCLYCGHCGKDWYGICEFCGRPLFPPWQFL